MDTKKSLGELFKEAKPFLEVVKEQEEFVKEHKINVPSEEVSEEQLNILWDKEIKDYTEENSSWLVQGFFKPKTISLIAGKRSTLKSWLALNVGYCVATGKEFLDKFPCEKANVLYIDRENGFFELKKRSFMEKAGMDIQEDQEIAFLSENHIKLDNLYHVELIENFIKENKIRLIIVDTYRRLISFKEDSADAVSKFFVDTLKPLAEKTGVAFIFIHHEKKGESSGDEMDMLRGSSDLANYVDTIIQVKRRGDVLTIQQTKQRGAKELEPFEVIVRTDEVSSFKFEYRGEKQSMEDIIGRAIIKWILEAQKKEFSYSELMNFGLGQNFKKTNIYSAIIGLQNKGIIEKGESKRSPYRLCNTQNLGLFE